MRKLLLHRSRRYSGRVAESSSRYHRIKHNPVITTASKVYEHLDEYKYKDKEYFLAITLDGSSRVINTHVISIGTLNQSLVHPREVFVTAIRDKAVSIILAHNHPSGQLEPSRADTKVTARLKDAGNLLGIEVIEHIILTLDGYYSFSDEGKL